MRLILSYTLVAGSLLVAGCAGERQRSDHRAASHFETDASARTVRQREFARIMQMGDVPGLAVAKVENSQVIWSEHMGRRDAMDVSPTASLIDEDTVFEGASLGKPLVAMAALWLHERGRLDLDESADAIVPYEQLKDERKRLLTPRMLMSHTSGLSFGQPALDAEPGSRYSYSTEGFRYLQRVVEHRLGESLESWLQKNVIKPLALRNTSFVYAERFASNRAMGRNWLDRGQTYMTNAAGTGAFDLITTADDYAALWAAVLRGEVLEPASVAMMLTPQLAITAAANDPTKPKREPVDLAAGLGLLLQRQNDEWIGFQWGDNGGSTAFVLLSLNSRNGAVFVSNAQDGLHAGQAIIAAAGMRDEAIGWIGYDAMDSKARVAWKTVTRELDRDAESAFATFERLRRDDPQTLNPLARNLGYYNKFRGFAAAAEPFYRVAAEQPGADADLLYVWAESLEATGKKDEAERVRAKAAGL